MDRAAWISIYNEINLTFKDTLIFRIGTDSGFFSEYNHLVLAVAYCLKHRIRFVLNSNYANFAIEDGWNDFFLPFCEESVGRFNKWCNVRPYTLEVENPRGIQGALEVWLGRGGAALAARWKRRHPGVYLTQDIFSRLRTEDFLRERLDVPALGLEHASLLETTRTLIDRLWHYTPRVAADVDRLRRSIVLPERYVSLHIRQGDKRSEFPLFDVEAYMAVARRVAGEVTDVFVATDDYASVERLRTLNPAYKFSTFTRPDHRGYDQNTFNRVTSARRYEELVNLFAAVDACAGAEEFIGTNTSNVGMYMGMRLGMNHCHFLDGGEWRMW